VERISRFAVMGAILDYSSARRDPTVRYRDHSPI
jgi:hypothetical protein